MTGSVVVKAVIDIALTRPLDTGRQWTMQYHWTKALSFLFDKSFLGKWRNLLWMHMKEDRISREYVSSLFLFVFVLFQGIKNGTMALSSTLGFFKIIKPIQTPLAQSLASEWATIPEKETHHLDHKENFSDSAVLWIQITQILKKEKND